MSRVNYYQSAFNSQKKKLIILAEMLEISKTGLDLQQQTISIRAPVGANKPGAVAVAVGVNFMLIESEGSPSKSSV